MDLNFHQLQSVPMLSIVGLEDVSKKYAAQLVTLALINYLRRQRAKTTFMHEQACQQINIRDLPSSAEVAKKLCAAIIGTSPRAWLENDSHRGDHGVCGADALVHKLAEPKWQQAVIETLEQLGAFDAATAPLAWAAWTEYIRNLISESDAPAELTAAEVRRSLAETNWPVDALFASATPV